MRFAAKGQVNVCFFNKDKTDKPHSLSSDRPRLSYFNQSVYEADVSKRSITQAYCKSRRDRDSGRKHVTGAGACCTLD